MNDRVSDNSNVGLAAGEDRAVIVLGGGDEAGELVGCGMETIGFGLDILGEVVDCRISFTDGEARLCDIVPLARSLSTKLALAMLDRLGMSDENVPCRKGCSVCCNYLIPLSIPEAFRFREEVLAVPGERGMAVLQRCVDISERILGVGLAECCRSEDAPADSETEGSGVSNWYIGLDLGCPLLSEGLCTWYDQRPAACREHIVTGSELACRGKGTDGSPGDESHIAAVPVSVVQALGELTAELEGSDVEAVMLPLALPWTEDNLDRGQRTWPARVMVERFVAILGGMASKSLTPDKGI